MATVDVVCLLLAFITLVGGHGMVTDPPNRSSMWRYGYPYPPNYDDDGLDCGGFGTQWDQNGGKCGLCGDSYSSPTPRDNENGGRYGLGLIPRRYVPGSVITATVNLTTSHLGYFEFNLCDLDTAGGESEECFDRYLLQFADGGGTRYKILSNDKTNTYKLDLQLPRQLNCKHCVLRWHYKTGNSWGTCEDGHEAMGCGAQETFRTCSDIAIGQETNKPSKLKKVPSSYPIKKAPVSDSKNKFRTPSVMPFKTSYPNKKPVWPVKTTQPLKKSPVISRSRHFQPVRNWRLLPTLKFKN